MKKERRASVVSLIWLHGGRGDQHHSFYLGSNIYLCGDNAKLMFGAEYDYLRSRSQDVYSGWTFAMAFRAFF